MSGWDAELHSLTVGGSPNVGVTQPSSSHSVHSFTVPAESLRGGHHTIRFVRPVSHLIESMPQVGALFGTGPVPTPHECVSFLLTLVSL